MDKNKDYASYVMKIIHDAYHEINELTNTTAGLPTVEIPLVNNNIQKRAKWK